MMSYMFIHYHYEYILIFHTIPKLKEKIYIHTLTGKKSGTLKKSFIFKYVRYFFLSQKFIFVLFPILHNFLLIYWVLPFNC
jgi:hypothetical protein